MIDPNDIKIGDKLDSNVTRAAALAMFRFAGCVKTRGRDEWTHSDEPDRKIVLEPLENGRYDMVVAAR